jgi:dTDP-4-dehydrorhamnose 3,5-epimerase
VDLDMKILPTKLPGVVVIETAPYVDDRGAFARLFCSSELSAVVGQRQILQINHSRTSMVGTVRGLHFQRPPRAEMKLVRCLKGRVLDVAIDLRAGSPAFLSWHAEELMPGNSRMLVIPEGCAHGFQVLEADSELLYLHTASHAPDAEAGIRFDDQRLAIAWPLPAVGLSARDQGLPPLSPNFRGLAV